MSHLTTINTALKEANPIVWDCLSDLGRRLYYPLGIPAQAQQARECRINATIGQLTDGHNGALPLPSMVGKIDTLQAEEVVLYTPTAGNRALRRLWAERLTQQGCGATSQPVVTQGLTHGLSLIADLFSDPDTDVLLPDPGWGNYTHIFGTRRGARILPYRSVSATGLDLDSIDQVLKKARSGAILVLNFPSNPIGYSPTHEEAKALLERVCSHPRPLVVVTDDAYQGMVWEEDHVAESLFPLLHEQVPTHILPIKIDGATKELFFFGGRVGFITFGCTGAAATVIEEKTVALIRSTISSGSTPSQNLVRAALSNPNLPKETTELRNQIRTRYETMKTALGNTHIQTYPFNSGFFVLIPVDEDPNEIRTRLLHRGVGVVGLPQASAIRLSYASVSVTDIPALVEQLQDVLG